jgi:hypothetical protein
LHCRGGSVLYPGRLLIKSQGDRPLKICFAACAVNGAEPSSPRPSTWSPGITAQRAAGLTRIGR